MWPRRMFIILKRYTAIGAFMLSIGVYSISLNSFGSAKRTSSIVLIGGIESFGPGAGFLEICSLACRVWFLYI